MVMAAVLDSTFGVAFLAFLGVFIGNGSRLDVFNADLFGFEYAVFSLQYG